MKKLYARYFVRSTDELAKEMQLVCVDNCGSKETISSIKLEAYNMSIWMGAYPMGKVDFVWL